jgi:chromate transporter
MVAAQMNQQSDLLGNLAAYFLLMSIFAVGGANAAVPEMHRIAVDVNRWMTDRQFTDLFAIAQVAPGPNVIIVTLIGYHVAGVVGALVATFAMCGPTCVLAFHAGRAWDRFRGAPGRLVLETALVPISVGLFSASACILAVAADRTAGAGVITLVTAGLCYWTRVNPLWLFAAAAAIGQSGYI